MQIRVTKGEDTEIHVRTVERIANMSYDFSSCVELPDEIQLLVHEDQQVEWINRVPDGVIHIQLPY